MDREVQEAEATSHRRKSCHYLYLIVQSSSLVSSSVHHVCIICIAASTYPSAIELLSTILLRASVCRPDLLVLSICIVFVVYPSYAGVTGPVVCMPVGPKLAESTTDTIYLIMTSRPVKWNPGKGVKCETAACGDDDVATSTGVRARTRMKASSSSFSPPPFIVSCGACTPTSLSFIGLIHWK